MTPATFIREANYLFSDSYLYSVRNEQPYEAATQKLGNKFRAFLRSQFKDWTLHNFKGPYCECSGFLEKDGKFIYVSLSDLRYWDNWAEDVLIRTADSAKDYHGHQNHRTTIKTLAADVNRLMENYEKEKLYRI